MVLLMTSLYHQQYVTSAAFPVTLEYVALVHRCPIGSRQRINLVVPSYDIVPRDFVLVSFVTSLHTDSTPRQVSFCDIGVRGIGPPLSNQNKGTSNCCRITIRHCSFLFYVGNAMLTFSTTQKIRHPDYVTSRRYVCNYSSRNTYIIRLRVFRITF